MDKKEYKKFILLLDSGVVEPTTFYKLKEVEKLITYKIQDELNYNNLYDKKIRVEVKYKSLNEYFYKIIIL